MKILLSVLIGSTLIMNPIGSFKTMNLKVQAESSEMNGKESSTENSTMFIQLEDPDEIDDGAIEIVDENTGDATPYSIIGPDNRTQVTDINAFPNLQIVQVESIFKDPNIDQNNDEDKAYKTFVGTGCLVGKDTVLTASHMLYKKAYGDVQSIKIFVGREGFDSRLSCKGTTAIIFPGYRKHIELSTEDYSAYGDDIGLVKLDAPIGDYYGYLQAVSYGGTGTHFCSYGYPGDKMTVISRREYSVHQWKTEGTITNQDDYIFFHNADTFSGQSGSPLLNSNNEVFAVHFAGSKDGTYNVAAVVTDGMLELINSANKSRFPVYRVYNPNTGEHFYTADIQEVEGLVGLGWKSEGAAWSVGTTGNPIYRLFNPNTGEHHFTLNKQEVAALTGFGWKSEGESWYEPTDGDRVVFRLRNPNKEVFNHHFTTNERERDYLVSVGWIDEGIAWKAY